MTEQRLQEIAAHLVDPITTATMGERYTMIWDLYTEVRRLREIADRPDEAIVINLDHVFGLNITGGNIY